MPFTGLLSDGEADVSSRLDMLNRLGVSTVFKVGVLVKEDKADKGRAGAVVVVQLITLSEMYWEKNWKSGCDQKVDLR